MAALVACLALAACGGDEADHGLGRPDSGATTGQGDAVRVTYTRPDGATWSARLTIEAEQQSQDSEPGSSLDAPPTLDLRLVARITSTHRAAQAGAARTEVQMRYADVHSPGVDPQMFAGEATGRVRHDDTGRPQAESLEVEGPLAREARRVLASLQVAGFGGGPLWIPDRPIRAGESWSVKELTEPEAFRALLQTAAQKGVEFPTPTLQGRVTVERITREDAGVRVELALDALIEMKGPVRAPGNSGSMALGERIQGTAVIDAATGIPLEIDVTRRRQNTVKNADGQVSGQETSRLRIHGRITPPAETEKEGGS